MSGAIAIPLRFIGRHYQRRRDIIRHYVQNTSVTVVPHRYQGYTSSQCHRSFSFVRVTCRQRERLDISRILRRRACSSPDVIVRDNSRHGAVTVASRQRSPPSVSSHAHFPLSSSAFTHHFLHASHITAAHPFSLSPPLLSSTGVEGHRLVHAARTERPVVIPYAKYQNMFSSS
jgi:hypothetical protein